MPRKARRLSPDTGTPAKRKGRKRHRDYHRGYGSPEADMSADDLPDVRSGADPTTATPVFIHRGKHRRPAG